jgi:hypothetical protein
MMMMMILIKGFGLGGQMGVADSNRNFKILVFNFRFLLIDLLLAKMR